ncbi:B3GALTL [Acanthosepion pharaonis]|uniref:B3GALTL n=1 Tax=Acanthosepion pharaonis TaxID=158019 RepID=A0A812EV01_ACAPH|nr:B3GALTL [Sepia pharaonis]
MQRRVPSVTSHLTFVTVTRKTSLVSNVRLFVASLETVFHFPPPLLVVFFTGIFINVAYTLEANKSENLALKDIVFVILTQQNTYHRERAKVFKKDFYAQLKNISKDEKPKLFFTHKKWPVRGYWTIFPLLSEFAENFSDKSWVFICEEEARIKLWQLVEVLKKYDSSKVIDTLSPPFAHSLSLSPPLLSLSLSPVRTLSLSPVRSLSLSPFTLSLSPRLLSLSPPRSLTSLSLSRSLLSLSRSLSLPPFAPPLSLSLSPLSLSPSRSLSLPVRSHSLSPASLLSSPPLSLSLPRSLLSLSPFASLSPRSLSLSPLSLSPPPFLTLSLSLSPPHSLTLSLSLSPPFAPLSLSLSPPFAPLSRSLDLCNALTDETAVIIHHFAFAENPGEFSFPNFALGFVMSLPLIKSLHDRWPPDNMRTDFSIDPKHELAMYIWNDGNGTSLQDVPEICKEDNCITRLSAKFPECGRAISPDDLFVAVKTCKKFREERIPVVKNTWAREAKHIEYYSDVEDPTIPSISLGIPNTERVITIPKYSTSCLFYSTTTLSLLSLSLSPFSLSLSFLSLSLLSLSLSPFSLSLSFLSLLPHSPSLSFLPLLLSLPLSPSFLSLSLLPSFSLSLLPSLLSLSPSFLTLSLSLSFLSLSL